MNKEDLIKLATMASLNMGLDPALVCSLCAHESDGWQQFAVRYEPAFYDRYISSMKGLSETEMRMRATSFGLTQIMGQTAREQGYDAKFLTQLLEPLDNLRQGLTKLRRSLDKNGGSIPAALLSYNGGGNANYPDLVLGHYKDYAYLNSATRQP
jgi:soluble lytic murein transglycosylase-like protein